MRMSINRIAQGVNHGCHPLKISYNWAYMTIPQVLAQAYEEWCAGEDRTLTDFAIWLGVAQANLSRWMSGKATPDSHSIATLAAKLGPKIIEAAGLSSVIGNDRLADINNTWHTLPEDSKNEIATIVARAKDRGRIGSKTKHTKR